MKLKLLFIGILVFTLVSCGEYEKILKSTDYTLKYKKAFEYYNNEEYTRAANIFDQIVGVFRGTNKSDTVSYYQAMSYYKQKDFIMSGHYFKTFFETYPYSSFAEEAEYLSAYCYYLNSPPPALDQENTTIAIESFQSFINKYPGSKHVLESKECITELQDKLVEKSKLNAVLYYDLGVYKSSIIALKNSLAEYPNTKYREELMWLVLDSNYQLARGSIESKKRDRFQTTLDEYYSFITEFPKSKYKKKAEDIYETAGKMVK
jgi:outer membrane protein assembly factor BamD